MRVPLFTPYLPARGRFVVVVIIIHKVFTGLVGASLRAVIAFVERFVNRIAAEAEEGFVAPDVQYLLHTVLGVLPPDSPGGNASRIVIR